MVAPSALRRALVKDEVSIFDLTDQVIVGEEASRIRMWSICADIRRDASQRW